jgi:hypothetical protein
MFSNSLEPKASAGAAPVRLEGWLSGWTASAVAAVLGLDMPSVSASQAPTADNQPQGGPHPTTASISASRGTVPAAELSAAAGTAPAVGRTTTRPTAARPRSVGSPSCPTTPPTGPPKTHGWGTGRPRSGSPVIGIDSRNDQRTRGAQLLAARDYLTPRSSALLRFEYTLLRPEPKEDFSAFHLVISGSA